LDDPRPTLSRKRPADYPATTILIVTICICYAIEMASRKTIELGAVVPWLFQTRQYWRLFTALFLHGGLLHLATNAFALSQIGSLYEMMFGTRRFLLVYFVSGLLASATSALHMLYAGVNGNSVGASGAIFGILGAFIFSIRRSPVYRNDRQARFLLPQFVFWILVNVGLGLQFPEIDNAAHFGGLVTGLMLGILLPHRVPPAPPGAAVIDV